MRDAAGQPADRLHLLGLAQLVFELHAIADIDHGGQNGALAVKLGDRTEGLTLHQRAVLAHAAQGQLHVGALGTTQSGQLIDDQRTVLLVQQPVGPRQVQQFLWWVAENIGAFRIDVDQAVVLEDVDTDQRLLHQAAVLRLGGAQGVFGAVPLGDIARHGLHAGVLAFRIEHQPRVLAQPDFLPRLGHAGKFHIGSQHALVGLLVVVLKNGRAIIGANEFREAAADYFVARIAEHPEGLGIDQAEVAFGIGLEDDVGGGGKQVAVAIFGHPQGILRRLPLGDVAVVNDDRADRGFAEEVARDAFGPADGAVAVTAAEGTGLGRVGMVEELADQFLPGRMVPRFDDIANAKADQVIRGVAEHAGRGGVRPADESADVHQHHGIDAEVDERGELLDTRCLVHRTLRPGIFLF